MLALIVVKTGSEEGGNSGYDMRTVITSLQALGIRHHMVVVENLPSLSYINTHDFIVIPQFTNGFETMIDNAGITRPIIGLSASAGVAGFGATPGISGTRSPIIDGFFNFPWSDEEYFAAFSGTYTLTTGKSLMTCAANQPINLGGAAQTNAGRSAMLSTQSAGGGNLYISAAKPNNHAMLPFLIQEAVNDGKMSAPPRKAPIVVGLDHINGQYAHQDPALLDKIASYVPPGGVIWCGIFNANASYFENMSQEVKTRLKKYQDSNIFKYCWHDHVSPVIGSSLDANGYDTVKTKSVISAAYIADKAIWESHGLKFDEENGYYNNGSTSYDEGLLELFSSDVSKMQSPLNDTVQPGFGFTSVRQIAGSNVSRPMETRKQVFTNYIHTKRKVGGIQIFPVYDMANGSDSGALDMPYDVIARWRDNFNWITLAINTGFQLYMHDEDFVSSRQSPGIDQHGEVQMQMIVDTCNYLKDIVVPFADPGNYVNKVNFV